MKLGEWVEVPASYFTDHPSAEGSKTEALVTEIATYEEEEYFLLYSPLFKYLAAFHVDYGE